MGYPRCHPYICPRWPYLVIGSFELENNRARITPDQPNSPPLFLKVEAQVKQAFDELKKENEDAVKEGNEPAAIPDYGMSILLQGKGEKVSDARVLAFLPFTAPNDNSKRMLPQRALDLYQKLFENRDNPSKEFYEKLIKAAL